MTKNIVSMAVQNVRKNVVLRVTRLVDIWNGLGEYLKETEKKSTTKTSTRRTTALRIFG
jgi:hypothetical protein